MGVIFGRSIFGIVCLCKFIDRIVFGVLSYFIGNNGDARITGILTIGTASITLDPNAKTLTGLEELKIGSGSTAITLKKSETTGEIEFADESGKETSVGIGTTVSINTTGIITASSMVVSGTTAARAEPSTFSAYRHRFHSRSAYLSRFFHNRHFDHSAAGMSIVALPLGGLVRGLSSTGD